MTITKHSAQNIMYNSLLLIEGVLENYDFLKISIIEYIQKVVFFQVYVNGINSIYDFITFRGQGVPFI